MMRLNLASGTDLRDGWINLDIVARWPGTTRGCDVIWDARKDTIPYADGSAKEIYAGYLFLHLAPHYHSPVLNEMYRVLAPDGLLTVGEVDMAIVLTRWLQNPSDARLSELIWGEQGNYHGESLAQYDKHCHGFTESSLTDLLQRHQFKDFSRICIHHPDVFYELTVTCRKA